jgi:hypothetical protein
MKNFTLKIALLATVLIGGAVCAFGYEMAPPEVSSEAVYAFAASAVLIPSFDISKLCCVTQVVFADLQAKYGKLYVIDVAIDADESYQFLIRRPTRQILELIESSKSDVSKVNDIIIKNLVVAGNEMNVLDDGIVFAQFNLQAAKIIQQGQAFFSKA